MSGMNSTMFNLITNIVGTGMNKAANGAAADRVTSPSLDLLDVAGYNYASGRYPGEGKLHPNRLVVGSETFPQDIVKNWRMVEKLPWLCGDFMWTAWDYLGEAGIGKVRYNEKAGGMFYASYPVKAAYCADFDLIGTRRPASYWREIIWGLRKAPYLCVQPPVHHNDEKKLTNWTMTDAVRSWNFTGQEGNPVTVEVYTDAEEAELFVNGRSVGRKKVGEDKKAQVLFETVYEPGAVRVAVYRDGQECGGDEIVTAGAATRILAHADRSSIPADASDICYVDICIADENCRVHPEANTAVFIRVEGCGLVQGFGSADPESEENYYDTVAHAFEGRLRAAIRSNGTAGEILVTLCAEGMEDVQVRILSE